MTSGVFNTKSISKKSLIYVYISIVFNTIQDTSACMSNKVGMQMRMRMPALSVRPFLMPCMQARSYSVYAIVFIIFNINNI